MREFNVLVKQSKNGGLEVEKVHLVREQGNRKTFKRADRREFARLVKRMSKKDMVNPV